jgi:hypothetical protein
MKQARYYLYCSHGFPTQCRMPVNETLLKQLAIRNHCQPCTAVKRSQIFHNLSEHHASTTVLYLVIDGSFKNICWGPQLHSSSSSRGISFHIFSHRLNTLRSHGFFTTNTPLLVVFTTNIVFHYVA